MTDSLAFAHALLVERVSSDRRARSEDPNDPETVQAMQIALHLPKVNPPRRTDLLEAAARAVVSVCLAEEVATDDRWRIGLESWYGHLIRKVARRARNKAWEEVQAIPGVTIDAAGALARAFVPTAVSRVPAAVRKLQIHGTELPADDPGPVDPTVPLIVIDGGLSMTTGKAAAQVGHASMLLAAARDLAWVRGWAEKGFPLNVREVTSAEFRQESDRLGAVVVRDGGYTEVEPGARTAVACAP
ncbi:peptidyl-tRNA hydrolase [Corynebacterium atrinae]|uniref:peptidyl-tRNA hydrolase n=1 Tax=Corynebacterium atrinae TaxID=1336740 RepID=UPI0025B5C4CE|nr:peptidyl-tRNA hydrolase [Corynebacterium atrinae]WJY64203.1 peptidyl-tRNA hydrolase [Corynebacterium atrinae]